MKYGINYMGSKAGIASELIEFFPYGKRLVDLFGGGFAISHCALLSGKYNKVLYNDIDTVIVDFVKDIINDNIDLKKPEWISREDFYKRKKNDGMLRSCWSFGGDGRTYMYGSAIEPYKEACHKAIVFDEWELLKKLCPEVWEHAYNAIKDINNLRDRKLKFSPPIVKELKRLNNKDLIYSNPLYKSVHWQGEFGIGVPHKNGKIYLQRLETSQSLTRLERASAIRDIDKSKLEINSMSYEDYKYKDGDVVYCDIPYEGSQRYTIKFNHAKFFEWAKTRDYPVFFSSYYNKDYEDKYDFKVVWSKDKVSSLCRENNSRWKTECIYSNIY